MEAIVEDVVDPADLKKFEAVYQKQAEFGEKNVSSKAQFDYAWCLIRSRYNAQIEKGVALLEDLFKKTADEGAKRDYLFYMAVGQTRLKNYEKALKYTNGILQVEPGNHQVKALEEYIKKKMKKDGLVGMAVIGGAAAIAVGGIIAGALAVAKHK